MNKHFLLSLTLLYTFSSYTKFKIEVDTISGKTQKQYGSESAFIINQTDKPIHICLEYDNILGDPYFLKPHKLQPDEVIYTPKSSGESLMIPFYKICEGLNSLTEAVALLPGTLHKIKPKPTK